MRTRSRTLTAVKYALIALFLAFLVLPVTWLISTAFKSVQETNSSDPTWLPISPTLDNFVEAFERQPILNSMLVSVSISCAAALIVVLLAMPAAYVMARYRGVFTGMASIWVLLSQMFPFILIIIPLFMTIVEIGLYDNLIGLVGIYVVWNLPFALWMLRNSIAAIPLDLEDAAAIDGASTVTTIRLVLAPLAVPGIVAASMFTFVSVWNEFFFSLVLIRSPELAPLSLLLVRFIGRDGTTAIGPLAAASIIAMIPTLIFFVLVQRNLASGLLGGAVKG